MVLDRILNATLMVKISNTRHRNGYLATSSNRHQYNSGGFITLPERRDDLEFAPEFIESSLSPDPNRRPRNNMKRETELPKIGRQPFETGRHYFSERDYGTISQIEKINEAFDIKITKIKDERLFQQLHRLAREGVKLVEPSTTLSSILSILEKRFEEMPDLVKIFISNTVRFGWIGARFFIPNFAEVEKIFDAYLEKDKSKLAWGGVFLASRPILSCLFRIIE